MEMRYINTVIIYYLCHFSDTIEKKNENCTGESNLDLKGQYHERLRGLLRF